MSREHRGASRALAAVATLAGALAVVASYDGSHPLGAFEFVVFAAGALVGRVAPSGHRWIALTGLLALAPLSLVLVLVDYDADPWWEIVFILAALVGCALAIAWCAGVWLGRFSRLRSLARATVSTGES